MTGILNTLRANAAAHIANLYGFTTGGAALTPLTAPANATAARDLLFQERAFWLLLSGHRLADLRRLVANYGVAANSVYPNGDYHKGGTYGTDLVFQIQFDESNNDNYSVDECDVSTAGLQ